MNLMDDIITIFVGILIIMIVILLITVIFYAICNYFIFKKAGEQGWKAFVPFLSSYTMFKISWEPMWFWIFTGATIGSYVLSATGIFAIITIPIGFGLIALSCIQAHKLSVAFGKDGLFTVGLILLPIVCYPILAWGSSQYVRYNQPYQAYNQQYYSPTIMQSQMPEYLPTMRNPEEVNNDGFVSQEIQNPMFDNVNPPPPPPPAFQMPDIPQPPSLSDIPQPPTNVNFPLPPPPPLDD